MGYGEAARVKKFTDNTQAVVAWTAEFCEDTPRSCLRTAGKVFKEYSGHVVRRGRLDRQRQSITGRLGATLWNHARCS